MIKKSASIDDSDLMRRMDQLITASQNRYRITVQVADRAKRRRYEDAKDDLDDTMMKPVKRAVIEMSDELMEPEIIGE